MAPGTETAESWMLLLQTYGGWGTTVGLALWYAFRERGRGLERRAWGVEREAILAAAKDERQIAAHAAKEERDEVVARNAARFRQLEEDRDDSLAKYEALAEKAAEDRAHNRAKIDTVLDKIEEIRKR